MAALFMAFMQANEHWPVHRGPKWLTSRPNRSVHFYSKSGAKITFFRLQILYAQVCAELVEVLNMILVPSLIFDDIVMGCSTHFLSFIRQQIRILFRNARRDQIPMAIRHDLTRR
jgi:hypothetical protein